MDQQLLNDGLGELHSLEIELLRRIREKYRFGELTLILHEGLPRKVKAVTVYEDLRDGLSTGILKDAGKTSE